MSDKCACCGIDLAPHDKGRDYCSSNHCVRDRHWSCYERELKQLRDWNMRFEERAIKAEAELAKFREALVSISNDSVGISGFHLNGDLLTWDDFFDDWDLALTD